MIDPSSKLSLKLSCLGSCKGNIAEAEKLYAFLSDGISEGLPDLDPVQPSSMDKIKQGVSDAFGWMKEHQEDITQGITLIKSLRSGKSAEAVATSAIPPIPDL